MKAFYHPKAKSLESAETVIDKRERLDWFLEVCSKAELGIDCNKFSESDLDRTLDELTLVHTKNYLDNLKKTSKSLKRFSNQVLFLDSELEFRADSLATILEAASSFAASSIYAWKTKESVFHFSRPGSHHAGPDYAVGFCVLNNLAFSAKKIQSENPEARVAILDLDIHHGNGTADILRDDPSVFIASIHESPFFPGTGAELVQKDTWLELPLPASGGDHEKDSGNYLTRLEVALAKIKEWKPDILLLELGVDGYYLDWTSNTALDASVFEYAGGRIAALSKELGIPVTAEVGGGYVKESFEHALFAFIQGFKSPLENELQVELPERLSFYRNIDTDDTLKDIYDVDENFLFNTYPYTYKIAEFLLRKAFDWKRINFLSMQINAAWENWFQESKEGVFEELIYEAHEKKDVSLIPQAALYEFAKFFELNYIDSFVESLSEFFQTHERFYLEELKNTAIWYQPEGSEKIS